MLAKIIYRANHWFKVKRFTGRGIARLNQGWRDDALIAFTFQVGDGTNTDAVFHAQQKVARKARSYGAVALEHSYGVLHIIK